TSHKKVPKAQPPPSTAPSSARMLTVTEVERQQRERAFIQSLMRGTQSAAPPQPVVPVMQPPPPVAQPIFYTMPLPLPQPIPQPAPPVPVAPVQREEHGDR